MDCDPAVNPDAVFDITCQEHWRQFKDASMDFIYFESTPFLDNMEVPFEQCLRILSDNGVVFYRGGSRDLPSKYESIPNLFQQIGFKQAITGRSWYFNQQCIKPDKGSLTLASKNSQKLSLEFISHNLPEEAVNIIETIRFFPNACSNERENLYPFFSTNTFTTIVGDESMSRCEFWAKRQGLS